MHVIRLLRPVGILALLFTVVTVAPLRALAATADLVHAGDLLRSIPVGIASTNCPTVAASLALFQSSKLNVTRNVVAKFPLLWSALVLDSTRWADGLPGIDFDGDGVRDVVLCVDTTGDGTFQVATECVSVTVEDLFVEIDYMGPTSALPYGHLPDPTAFANVVGVRSHSSGPGYGINPTAGDVVFLHVTVRSRMTGAGYSSSLGGHGSPTALSNLGHRTQG